MKPLPLSAVITTSAIAVSQAFTTVPLPRTPLHLPFTTLQATGTAAPLDPSIVGSSIKVSGTRSGSISNNHELTSFAGSHQRNHVSSSGSVKRGRNRYGGRATSGGIIPPYNGINGRERHEDVNNRAVLGFDFGLNVVSRPSDWAAQEQADIGSIIDVNHASTSPIKKQIASMLQSESRQQGSILDFFENQINDDDNGGGGGEWKTNAATSQAQAQAQRSSVPGWFPYTPTRRQIESLKVMELRDACHERGLPKSGKKLELQDTLLEWTNIQHRRRVLERNALHASGDSPLQDAINAALYDTITTPIPLHDQDGYKSTYSTSVENADVDCVEPLINRRKSLLRSKKLSFSKSKGKLGFDTNDDTDDDDDVIARADLLPTKDYLSDLKKTFARNVDTAPNNYQVKQLYQQAKYADQVGDVASAKVYLLKLLEVTPRDTRVIRRLARLEMQEGKVHKAREILQSGLRSMPKNGDILQGLGQLELKYGNTNSARRYFKEAIVASPRFPNPYHALATLEHSEGNIRVATTLLRIGLKHCPSNHRLHHALGDLYREAKMLDMAQKAYRKGLKCIDAEAEESGRNLDWGKSFLYTALSYVSYDTGEAGECRQWLRKSIDLANNRMHSQGWLGLAQLEESERDIEKAREVYSEALDVYEQQRCITSFRASSRSMIGRKKFIKPAKLGDKWINVYNSWAKLEEQYGDYHDASNVFSRAAAAFPKDCNILSRWAQFQVKYERLDRARTLFELACDVAGSRDAKPYRLYAEFEMSSGNYRRAKSILFLGAQSLSESSDGAEQSDEFARLYHSWAVCEWHLGNLDRAEVLFDHGLRLTDSGSDGSESRALILYSIARFLFYARNDCSLAQHCIGLSLTENLTPGGNAGIWLLWAKVARAMCNDELQEQCLRQADELNKKEDSANGSFPVDIKSLGMSKMLRRAPWQYKIQSPSREKDSWYKGISFPKTNFSPVSWETLGTE